MYFQGFFMPEILLYIQKISPGAKVMENVLFLVNKGF